MMSLQYDECPTNVTVQVFCDNAQVVLRSNDMDYVKVKVSEYNVLDYDLWKLTQEIQAPLPFHVEYHWVKSHQEANDDGKPLHGPFARDAELNIMADSAHRRTYLIVIQLVFHSMNLQDFIFLTIDGVVINNYSRHIGMKT